MGCIGSKADINDRHPNIFQVTNINDQGRKIKSGKLQVTDTDLVFYQRGKKPTKWPLRSLRKYGFDTEIFSFECGRRCPTGHGIYAFKCRKAEMMFNVVQQHITGNITEDFSINHGDLHGTNGQVLISRRTNSNSILQPQTEGYLNPVSVPLVSRSLNETNRPSSLVNTGPPSPTITSPPLPEISKEHNNNKSSSLTPDPTYTNSIVLENGLILPQYANLDAEAVEEPSNNSHLYVNVDMPHQSLVRDVEESRCYANINTEERLFLPNIAPITTTTITTTLIPYVNADQSTFEEVNYAELDLKGSEGNDGPKPQQVPQVDPSVKEKYATIDFHITTALSKSKNPSMAIEEGSRKTRHNSTINYNSSISD